MSDAVLSARGSLAVVRRGHIEIGDPGHLRRLADGRSPVWSPTGSRLALVASGWIEVADPAGGTVRLLVRGTSPAWSPDGRWIAFIGAAHRVERVSLEGGAPVRVGQLRGREVSWGPAEPTTHPACAVAPGSIDVAESAGQTSAVVEDTRGESTAVMGCPSTGRVRLLERESSNPGGVFERVSDAAVAGDMAALVSDDNEPRYGNSSQLVTVFDLRTGRRVVSLGGQASGIEQDMESTTQMSNPVINPRGFTAVLITLFGDGDGQEIEASDSTGLHVEATAQATAPALSGLELTGNLLTWQAGQQAESALLG